MSDQNMSNEAGGTVGLEDTSQGERARKLVRKDDSPEPVHNAKKFVEEMTRSSSPRETTETANAQMDVEQVI